MATEALKIGVIGCGHWGPNHIRIFSQLSGSEVVMCADPDEKRLEAIAKIHPDVDGVTDYQELINNPDIDAVCVASPTDTHVQITKEALENNKHVLCEKPLALNPQDCQELAKLARLKKRALMVGHIFLFNAGIVWLKNYIESGELGDIHYAYSTRTNLGPFRYDVNAMWDLAPHDISIFNYLFDACPATVSACGQKCIGEGLEDIAFATLEYPNNMLANIHVSWLDPKKVRQITIVGDKKMVVWDDLDDAGPIKLYDKYVEKTKVFYETYGEFQLLSKEGSITMPNISASEPLKAQGEYFLKCINENLTPDISDAQKGMDVVSTLTAIQSSMDQKGLSVKVS